MEILKDFEATNTGYMGCFLIKMVINIEVNILTIKDLYVSISGIMMVG